MGRLGKVISQQKAYDEQQKKLEADAAKQTKAAAGGDTRPIANKIFDALNPLDSGRSFTTATPDKKAAKKSAGDQAKSALGGVVDSITSPFKRLGAGGAEVLNEVTGGADREQEAYQKSQDDNMAILKDTRKKIKAETDPAKKARLQKAADVISGNMDDANKSRTKRLNEVIDRTDPVKAAASVGEVGLDVLTAGTGGAAVQGGKLAAKEAAKETVEAGGSRLAKRIAQTAATAGGQGGTSGALSAVEQKGKDVSLKDVATGALGGAVTGAAFGGGAAGLGEVIRNLPKGEGGFVKNPFYKAQIGDDLANEIKNGKVHGDITEHPTENLQLGSDTVSDPLDRATVDNYKAKLQAGEPLDPILVHTAKDGTPMVQDGAHRLAAAQELGIKSIPTVEKADNVVMAAKVTPPTEASLSATVEKAPAVTAPDSIGVEAPADATPSVQLKVLDDLQREADVRTPGGAAVPAAQDVATKTQKGAQYLVDDIDKLQKDTNLEGIQPLDREAAGKLTGEVHRSNFQEFKDKMGRNFQDTLTYGARTLGKTGSDFVYNMLQGNKFKRDALDALRENMSTIGKLNKDIAGKSVTAKRDLGARLGQALDDRANADNFLKTPQEKDLFNQYVNVFDYVKQLREKSGLETLDNYRPWVDMKDASEPPTWLSENVTNKRTQTLSRFSKERTKTAPGANVDNNLADMIYGYVNSQLNEMAYDAPVKKLKGGLEDLSSGNKANVGAMNEGIDYMRELVQQAVNPARKNPLERAAGKLTSNVYGAVLPFNVRLAIQNKTQQFVANSRVSKGAVSLAKKLSESDAKELEGGLVFGDTTVYGQLEDVNPTKIAKKGIGQKLAKVDPYQKSEHGNVITSYHKGAMQAVLDSQPYKDARASGLKPIDAVHQALQNPDVKEAAIRRGNVVVNDTQFGASPLARPEMLREEGSIWGVLPKKTVYMFTRFPIGMSQHVLELLDNKSARASEMLKNGDPRAVSVSEMRTNYQALLSSMKDAKVALKDGTDIGIPGEVLNKQIATVSKNLSIIDKESKNLSSIRGGKTVKNVAKMWAAAAAIQIIFDGGIQNFANDPGGTTAKAISQTNPTMGNRVVGEYSPLASISSSASPINKYGKLNTRAVANYIPGVGLAVNRGRDVKKVIDSLTGSSNDQ